MDTARDVLFRQKLTVQHRGGLSITSRYQRTSRRIRFTDEIVTPGRVILTDGKTKKPHIRSASAFIVEIHTRTRGACALPPSSRLILLTERARISRSRIHR